MKNFKFTIQGKQFEVDILKVEDNIASIEVNGTPYDVQIHKEIKTTKTPTIVRTELPKKEPSVKPKKDAGVTPVKAPLPGNILDINVKTGDTVKKGDVLLIMEAMKMENKVLCEKDGVIKDIKVSNGDAVLQNDVLIEIA